MALDVENVSLELIAALKPLIPLIRKHDRSLADQLARAANSIALNAGEGAKSDAGNARARFSNAAGSANETRMALRVALVWGSVTPERAKVALQLLDRIVAMLWKLSRR
ncbi:MAG TPA: four helix bundle protein [Polyangiaceae bacterium]|jgi:four helix bundle protein|nr:four helix bundle protein [Polyangiaceae bacterium]